MAGSRRQTMEQAEKLISDAKKQCRIPIGANIFCMLPSEEEKDSVTNAASRLCECGADFIELDTTGNLSLHFGETEETAKMGEYFLEEVATKYIGFVHGTILSVKAVVDVPVMAKVAYENLNVPVLLQAMEKAAIDIIDIGNAGMGVMPQIIDIYNPEKIKGDDIPLLARIISVADAFDAMTTDRPYGERRTKNVALEELSQCAGTQFDGKIVDAFIHAWDNNAFSDFEEHHT